jgi:hypothetical protein
VPEVDPLVEMLDFSGVSDTVTVPRKELDALLDELESLRKELDQVGRLRLDAARLYSRVRSMVSNSEADDLTPVNPPSHADIKQAFKSSSNFLAVTLPKKKP